MLDKHMYWEFIGSRRFHKGRRISIASRRGNYNQKRYGNRFRPQIYKIFMPAETLNSRPRPI
jgi:hypothetical protein